MLSIAKLRSVRPDPRAAAIAVVAVALYGVSAHIEGIVRQAHLALNGPGTPLAVADLDPLRNFASTDALEGARRIIPPDATYSIVVGDDPPLNADPSIAADDKVAVPRIFQFWLLPRRYTKNVHEAQWVIAYHISSEIVGVPYSEEIGVGPAVDVVKVSP